MDLGSRKIFMGKFFAQGRESECSRAWRQERGRMGDVYRVKTRSSVGSSVCKRRWKSLWPDVRKELQRKETRQAGSCRKDRDMSR